jgi:two-component system sensor histidine kinase HydH
VLAQLDATTQRLDAMLGNTLNLLRPSRMLVEFIDINDALTQALFFIQRDRRRGVTLEMDLAEDLPLVHVDGEQLQQVFLNLALNALQAMGSDGTLTITTRVEQERGAPVMVVTFSDTGPGIPEDQQERIFEPLYTTRADGTGLGLSTSRRIIERHGGHLSAVSQTGHGASFIVRLPIGMEPRAGQGSRAPKDAPRPSGPEGSR